MLTFITFIDRIKYKHYVVKTMIKTIRVMLLPNNKQKTKLFQYANTARFAYNWALGREQENYKNGSDI